MRAKKYVDIKDNIAMITLHNVKRTYRSVMEMKRELQKNESDKKKHSKGLTIDKLNALSYEICMNDMTGQGIRMVCKEKKFLFVHRLWDWLMHMMP